MRSVPCAMPTEFLRRNLSHGAASETTRSVFERFPFSHHIALFRLLVDRRKVAECCVWVFASIAIVALLPFQSCVVSPIGYILSLVVSICGVGAFFADDVVVVISDDVSDSIFTWTWFSHVLRQCGHGVSAFSHLVPPFQVLRGRLWFCSEALRSDMPLESAKKRATFW